MKKKKRLLVACEFSGTVRDAFKEKGWDAWSCDLLPTESPGQHYECDVLEVLDKGWDIMIAHPTCTYLTNAGVRHLHDHVTSKNGNKTSVTGSARFVKLFEAAEFFNKLKNADIPKICIENPTPHKYAKALIGDYTQAIQPWQFGHKATKRTCLWLKNLTKLKPTDIVGPPPKDMTQEEKREWHAIHYASPGKDRWKKRSITYTGIAKAMAEAWS